MFVGSHRFRVQRWLPDDPYPRADVEEIADEDWDQSSSALLAEAEVKVRRALEMAAELGETRLAPSFGLVSDPALAAWQLCAVAPLGEMDRQQLLLSPTHPERLQLLIDQASDVATVLAFRLYGG